MTHSRAPITLLRITVVAASILAGHVRANDVTSALPTAEVRTENDIYNDKSIAEIDAYTGNLTSAFRDVYILGNGGNPLEVYRRYDGSRLRARIWDEHTKYGVSSAEYTPQENAALGKGAWTLTAAPIVNISVEKRWSDDLSLSMTDSLDKVCTGQPFRANGNTGAYGTTIIYSLVLPDGRTERLVPVQTGVVQSFGGWRLTCSGGQGGLHILQSPTGDKYSLGLRITNSNMEWSMGGVGWTTLTFTATRRDDRNGNWLTYSYTNYGSPARPQLASVTASDGRSLAFSYQLLAGEIRLTQISSNWGASWTYQYDSLGQLSSHSDSVGRAWQYSYYPRVAYNNSSTLSPNPPNHGQPDWAKSGHLKTLTLPTSGTISFQYQPSEVWGRGVWWWEGMMPEDMESAAYNGFQDYGGEMLDVRANWSVRTTQKSTSDGGVWNYSYSPSKTNGVYDVTTIQTPAGTEVHKFVGEGFFLPTSVWSQKTGVLVFYYPWGGTTGDSAQPIIRNAWRLGTLVEVNKGGIETDVYEWTAFQHSGIYYQATSGFAGLRDEVTYRPVLSRVTKTVNGAAYATSYSNFDAYGNAGRIETTGPNGGNRIKTVTYFNDATKWIIGKVKDESFTGSSTIRQFNANGDLQLQTVNGVSQSWTYDAEGNVASTTFPRNLTHYYSSYFRGIARTETQPEGVTIQRVVSNDGTVASETDGEGMTTAYGYDLVGRVVSETPPTGNVRYTTYTANTMSSTRGSLSELVELDGFARPVRVTKGGVVTTYQHDALGRRQFESSPGLASGTTFAYDILDRPTRITNADGTYSQISYGAGSKTVTNERGFATTFGYRGYGNPSNLFIVSISTPIAASSVAIQRNSMDLITSITQAGKTRTYGYNSNYHLTSVVNPETGTTTLGRDAAGNITSRSVGGSGVATYTYDNQNRQATASFSTGPAITRSYNKRHQLVQANSSSGNRSFSYDNNGNILSESLIVDGYSFTAGYTYNANDALSSISYPRSGAVVNLSPDQFGRPTTVSGYIAAISYWPTNAVQQISYGNGTTTSYGMNTRLLVSSFSTSKGSAGYINSAYTYDEVGNLTGISDAVDGGFNRGLTYDGLDRLITASGPWGQGAINYDGGGNITYQSFGAFNLTYSYDSSNRLSGVTGQRVANYTYDAYGSIASGSGNTYSYDDVPRLRCVNCNDVANKTEFSYDGTLRRSVVSKGGVKTYEMRGHDGNLLVEFTPSSNKLIEYFYIGDKRIAQRATP